MLARAIRSTDRALPSQHAAVLLVVGAVIVSGGAVAGLAADAHAVGGDVDLALGVAGVGVMGLGLFRLLQARTPERGARRPLRGSALRERHRLHPVGPGIDLRVAVANRGPVPPTGRRRARALARDAPDAAGQGSTSCGGPRAQRVDLDARGRCHRGGWHRRDGRCRARGVGGLADLRGVRDRGGGARRLVAPTRHAGRDAAEPVGSRHRGGAARADAARARGLRTADDRRPRAGAVRRARRLQRAGVPRRGLPRPAGAGRCECRVPRRTTTR